MNYKDELQNIDNPNKAYLLGLFYADGNIGNNTSDVRLYLKDSNLIIKLYNKFRFFNIYETNKGFVGIHLCTSRLKNHFVLHGCLPQKSSLNKDNIEIPFYNNLTKHFIRGYFDGDGGCSLTKYKNKIQKRVYIYSASYDFLIEIQNILLNNNIRTTIGKNQEIFILTIRTCSYKHFYNYMYSDSELFLERKKEKFKEILQTNFFIQKNAPNCKFCNSNNTVFNGNYSYKGIIKPRILCKNCNKNFVITAPVFSNNNSGEDELLED